MNDVILISYIEDLRESIVTLNEALMSVQGGSHDSEHVNNIFRAAHTIKGNSAAMGFMNIQGVMHSMEDLLAEVRNGTRELTDKLVVVLFACHDFLEDSLQAVERESTDESMNPDKLLSRLAEFKDNKDDKDDKASAAAAVPAAAQPEDGYQPAGSPADIDLAVDMPTDLWELLDRNVQNGGYHAYKIDIKFLKNSSMRAVRAWMIFDLIENSSILLYSDPPRIGENDFAATGETAFENDVISAVVLCENEISGLVADLKEMADIEKVEASRMPNEDISDKVRYLRSQKKVTDGIQEIGVELLGGELQYISDETIKTIVDRLSMLKKANIGGSSSPVSIIANRMTKAFEQALQNKKKIPMQERGNIILLCQNLEELINSPKKQKDGELLAMLYRKLDELIEVVTAPDQRVGDILTSGGYISTVDADSVEAKRKDDNLKFGQAAVKEKLVSALDVVTALGDQEKGAAKGGTAAALGEGGYVRVPVSKIDSLIDMLSELLIYYSQLEQSAQLMAETEDSKTSNILSRTEKLIKEIQDLSMSFRMIEVRSTFHRLVRVVRDTATDLGKKIVVTLEGEDTEIDRSAIEKLYDPLMHMVRNSVDHGIESSEEERTLVGKKPEGQVTIAGSRKQGNVLIEVRDDGKGINTKKVYDKALEKGLISEHREYTDEEIFKFIFLPGFSTQENVSSVSGRGVGMNVVEEAVTKLGGRVEIDSELGAGSTFRIKLPVNLAVLNGTIVDISGDRYIIPTLCVKKFFTAKKRDLVSLQGANRAIKLDDGSIVSMVSKSRVFGISDDEFISDDEDAEYDMVLLEVDEKLLVLRVDKILSRQDVVSKPLMADYASVSYANSASILGDGVVSLILDIDSIFKMSQPT